MKVLQVGDFYLDYYDESLFIELNRNSMVTADKFQWNQYFSGYSYRNFFTKVYYTLENRYKFGPLVCKFNRDLISAVKSNSYDAVFLWRAIHIYPSTISELKKHAVIIGYNNDQTFSLHHPWWLFFMLKRSIPFYDHFFVYRQSDQSLIESLGTTSSVFMPTFDPDKIYPIDDRSKIFDVIFVGHYENDGRDELLLRLVEEGFKVCLNGQRWQQSRYFSQLTKHFGDIKPVYDKYNEALNSAKVCLSFLSKLNNDTYTRRTLEVPATKTVMLAEYTKDQAEMFEPNIEAVYFSNHQEAVNKLRWLVDNPDVANSIACAGYKKVFSGSYQLKHRVDEIMKITEEKMAVKNEK